MFKLVSCLLLSILYSFSVHAKNYYLSNEGNDRGKGTSPSEAWQNLSRLQKVKLNPGDTVFFKRGDTFFGGIEINRSGKKGKPIVFTAYGEGVKPVLTGAKRIKQWKQGKDNIYTARFTEEVFDVYVDGAWQTPARFPNTGFIFSTNDDEEKNTLMSDALTQTDGYWEGATLRMRTIDWAFESRVVTDYAKGKLTIGKQDRYIIERGFVHRSDNGNTFVYPIREGFGFFLESPKALDTLGEWSQAKGEISMVLPAEKSPQDLKVMATVHKVAIQLSENVKHIVISNLAFQQYELGAIRGSYHIKNLEISNNDIANIHQIGIRLDSASADCKIVNNQIHDILGRGVDASEPVNLEIKGNQVKRIGAEVAQGWTGVNGGIGILISNIERKDYSDTTYAHHNTVAENIIDSCGYVGVRVDGHHNLVEYNLIQNIGFTLNDGASLYCYGSMANVTRYSTFRKNIIKKGFGNTEGTSSVWQKIKMKGIYLDNRCSHIVIEDNVVLDFKSDAIMINDKANNNTVRNNTTFNTATGIAYLEWDEHGGNFGNVTEGNLVVNNHLGHYAIGLRNSIGPQFTPSKFDNNFYVNPTTTLLFQFMTKQVPDLNNLSLTFDAWKRITGEDTNSKAITASTEWAKGYEAILLLNETLQNKTIQIEQGALTLEGEAAPKSIELAPFTSRVLLQKR